MEIIENLFVNNRSTAGLSSRLYRVPTWKAWCFLFDVLGGHFNLLGTPWKAILAFRDHPGRTWEQQDGFEVVDNRMCFDFAVIVVAVYVSFWISKYLTIHVVFGLVSSSSFCRFLIRNFNVWEFQQMKVFA